MFGFTPEGIGICDEPADLSKGHAPVPVSHESEVADFPESFRQDVQDEFPDERFAGQMHHLCGIPGSAVDPGKGNPVLCGMQDAFLMYADTMGISTQVFHHLGRAAERRFGIDDEGFACGFAESIMEDRFGAAECFCADGMFQPVEEYASKYRRQTFDRNKVRRTGGNPARTVL